MSATNGSQFFFWFNEASVEMTPKLISLGVSARTATKLPIRTRAANALFPSSDDIDRLPIALESVKQTSHRSRELGRDPDSSLFWITLYARTLSCSSPLARHDRSKAMSGPPPADCTKAGTACCTGDSTGVATGPLRGSKRGSKAANRSSLSAP